MKFGKKIQQRQLELPEYASSFTDYKALKKLIKQLCTTQHTDSHVPKPNNKVPNAAQETGPGTPGCFDHQSCLRANKDVFFFRLEREIEKINVFYLQKEAEFQVRLKTLLEKKPAVQRASAAISNRLAGSKTPTAFVSLFEGFQQFDTDLHKLQQYVETNETAISKILKKWDKTSKSHTKELYLQRAVEVQPCFNRDVLRSFSDRATTAMLEMEALAEGENFQLDFSRAPGIPLMSTLSTAPPVAVTLGRYPHTNEIDDDAQLQLVNSTDDTDSLRQWLEKVEKLPNCRVRVTRMFLLAVSTPPSTGVNNDPALMLLLNSGLVDVRAKDDINGRNCIHAALVSGRDSILEAALSLGGDASCIDTYGRIPLHDACIYGHVGMLRKLLEVSMDLINARDHDNFTPLLHGVLRNKYECVAELLARNARVDPESEADHIPLNLACRNASLPIVQLLLSKRPKLLPDAEGLYPQHVAARSPDGEPILPLLRDYGADLDQKDKVYQWTPLFHAASEGRINCLQTLIRCGVNVEVIDEKELPAIYYAAWEGHVQCMGLLFENQPRRKQEAVM